MAETSKRKKMPIIGICRLNKSASACGGKKNLARLMHETGAVRMGGPIYRLSSGAT